MKARSRILMTSCVAVLAWGAAAAAWAGAEQVSAAAKDGAKSDTARVAEETPAPGDFVYVDELPKSLTKVAPVYPEGARKRHEQGTVFVQALVSKKGMVLEALVRAGKGVTPELDKAAKEAVSQWTFEPAKAKGKPVAVWVMVPVKFRLK
jgi:protein TonB